MKLCAVVVTYYPQVDEAVSNIRHYLDGVDHLIIWVNTPEKDAARHTLTDTLPMDKVTVMTTGKNEGISYPLNQAIAWAKANGYTHLLTMDQDSEWIDFAEFKQATLEYWSKYMIIGPNINEWYVRNGLKEVLSVITSGTIYDMRIFDCIGNFDEKLFIDTVDTEFSYRARLNGYKSVVITDYKLKQVFGTEINKYFTSKGYSAFRRYHIVRNHIWLWKKYPQLIDSFTKKWIMSFIYKEPIKVVAQENDKWNKVYSTFKGVLHGLTGSLPK